MDDAAKHVFLDNAGNERLRRKPQPFTTERLTKWASALFEAYHRRKNSDVRQRRSPLTFPDLLRRIEKQMARAKRRSGTEGEVLCAVEQEAKALNADCSGALRFEILLQTIAGKMTPEQAELSARRLGMPQIGKRQARALCNPMQLAEWSLLMAAVWIEWRDFSYVSRITPDSTEFVPAWVQIEHEDGSTGYDVDPREELDEVTKLKLMNHLRSGSALASGYRNSERREIGSADWLDLAIVGRHSGDGFATVASLDGQRDVFERVSLSREALLKVFPTISKDEQKTGDAKTEPPIGILKPTRRRGKPAVKSEDIAGRMRSDYPDLQVLADEKQEVLQRKYGAARATCAKARDMVLGEQNTSLAPNGGSNS